VSFQGLLDRTVSIVPTTVQGKDRANNDVRVAGTPILGVRARRDQVAASESLDRRSELATTFVYVLSLTAEDGTPVVITGRDRIVDGNETFDVQGSPELVQRRRRPHHLEAVVRLVEG
jgi:hypothetical protein